MTWLLAAMVVAAAPGGDDSAPWRATVEFEGRASLVEVGQWSELGVHLGALASLQGDEVRLGGELRSSVVLVGAAQLTGSSAPQPEDATFVAPRLMAGVRGEWMFWRGSDRDAFLGVWAGLGGLLGHAILAAGPDTEGTVLLGLRLRAFGLSWTATLSAGANLAEGRFLVPVLGLGVRAAL